MADTLAELHDKHLRLANNMRKLKARHEAALREIAFLRARLTEAEPHAPQPAILSGFPDGYDLVKHPRTPVTHWKEAREKLLWSGMTRDQALHLELGCLTRLGQGAARAHFPRLLAIDLPGARFEVTDQGTTLRALTETGGRATIIDAEAQIATIMAALETARVIHLDMHKDGRNLCVDPTGRLSLIDFDIAALDGVAFSGEIAQRLAAFHAEGGYAGFGARMRACLTLAQG